MDDRDEFNKIMKKYFDDMTKYFMQGFKLVATQLRVRWHQGVVLVPIMERHVRPFILNTFMIG